MKPNLENLKRHYSELSDEKLIELATVEARDLHEDAIGVLKQELNSRGLLEEIKGMEVALSKIDEKTFNNYLSLVRNQPCPFCGNKSKELNAVIIDTVKTVIIASSRERKLRIGCHVCLTVELEKAMSESMPGGIKSLIWLIDSESNNKSSKKALEKDTPTYVLQNWVWRNLGAIEANKGNPEGLKELMLHPK